LAVVVGMAQEGQMVAAIIQQEMALVAVAVIQVFL
jgi:hypothetical protein